MLEETQKAIWNIDGAEMYAIFEIKTKFIESLLVWDLDAAYWAVRTLRMELDSKLKRREKKIIEEAEKAAGKKKEETEKVKIDNLMEQLSGIREIYNKESNPLDEEKSKYYFALETFYMELCHIMKKHGMYFREGEDKRIPILRR